MDADTIIALIAALLGGGALGKLLELWFKKQRQDHDELRKDRAEDRLKAAELLSHDQLFRDTVLANITKQRDDAWSRVDELEKHIERLELTVQGLLLAQNRDPFPRWIVNSDGKYLYVNRLFEEMFLRSRNMVARDLIGKFHKDFWPKDFADRLHLLDEEAKRRIDGKAKMHTIVNGIEVTVYKMPIRDPYSNAVIGYDGIVTDVTNPPEPLHPASGVGE